MSSIVKLNTEYSKRYDYKIIDLTNFEFTSEEDVNSPILDVDISDILNKVDNKLTESFGKYGTINILFTRSSKTDLHESALLEYHSKGRVFALQVKITNSSLREGYLNVTFRNTLGKKLYEKETKNPDLIINSFFKYIHYRVNV